MVAQVLEQAATVTATPEGPYEMFDYVISLREGITDAWGGIIGAMKSSNKSTPKSKAQSKQHTNRLLLAQALQQYVPTIFQLLGVIASDSTKSEGLLRSCMGVIG